MNETTPENTAQKKPCKNPVAMPGWLTFALFSCLFLIISFPIAVKVLDSNQYKQVESFEEIGTITGASYSSSFMLSTSAIQTTTGTYVGAGFLQAVNGHRMRIEKRGNGDRALCDVETNACVKMLGK